MKKWLLIAFLAFAAMIAWVGAGPFRTMDAIGRAVERGDTAELSRHVDFPAVRASIRAQLDDYLVRRAGAEAQASPYGALALRIAAAASGGIVDALASPAGIGLALQGREVWQRISGQDLSAQGLQAQVSPEQLLEHADYRFDSPSRFTATVPNRDGAPVVFVLTRDGLHWRMTDVRLPLAALDPTLPPPPAAPETEGR